MKLFEINQLDINFFLSEGITHIDDQSLAIEKFIHVLKNLEKFEISEKVDGANLWVGLDMLGNLFTSRAHKGGEIFYSPDDWSSKFSNTGFKSAHAALEKIKNILKTSGMIEGDIIELEILFGDKPNAIPYWPNQIIFLRPIEGEPDIDKIADSLNKKTIKVKVNDIPYTNDGITIEYKDEIHEWIFSKVPKFDIDLNKIKADIDLYIKKIENFLYAPNISNLELIDKNGNKKIPSNIEVLSLRATTSDIKKAKDLIKDIIEGKKDSKTGKRIKKTGLKFKIKEILLDKLVRNARSTLGPEIDQGGWIEGVVLRSKHTGKNGNDELYKIVDTDIFTAVNQFNHQVRKFLTTKHKGENTPRESAGIMGNLLRDLASSIGYPRLGTIQAKRYLKKLGDSPSDILDHLSKNINVSEIKTIWLKELDKTYKLLENLLEQYKKQYKNKKFVDSIGRIHKYDKTIHIRTLQVFAELFKDLNTWKKVVTNAKKPEELIMILIGDKIKGIK